MKPTKKTTLKRVPTEKQRTAAREAVAQTLSEKDFNELEKVAKQNRLDAEWREWTKAKRGKKPNHGTARMSLGNVLAARVAKGENVKVAGRIVHI